MHWRWGWESRTYNCSASWILENCFENPPSISIYGMVGTLLMPNLCFSFSFLCKDYEYPLHSHSAHYQKNDRCPPPPQTLPDRACEVPSCRSDSECERHKRCCYNGCIYACLESVQPPPGREASSQIGAEPCKNCGSRPHVQQVVGGRCGWCELRIKLFLHFWILADEFGMTAESRN